ncbi:MAG: hypothetical protein JWR37_362 [Mycobacterium sp.]|jgi:hypothetical protein|nr:hypothetical protein [Mycobacterium sp.]
MSIFTVLLIQDAFVDEAFRGHRLAPWAIAEVVYRMSDTINGLVVMCPHLCGLVVPTIWDRMEEVYDHSYRYWQQHLNLEPVRDGFLGQATAFTHLENGRAALDDVRSTFVALDAATLAHRRQNKDPDLWPLASRPTH